MDRNRVVLAIMEKSVFPDADQLSPMGVGNRLSTTPHIHRNLNFGFLPSPGK